MSAPSELADRVTRITRSARAERLRARAPRYAFIAAATILALLGARQLLFPPSTTAPTKAAKTSDLAMHAFASGFARVYLTYDADDSAARERALTRFVPDDLGPDAGFTPAKGSQSVLWAEVASDQEAVAGGRIVTVAAQTDDEPDPTYLAVPIARLPEGALVLAGYPAFVGAPITATTAEEPAREPVTDPDLAATAQRVIANYLAGSTENLAADLSRDAAVSLPTTRLQIDQGPPELAWADRPGGRAVLATVQATDPDGNTHTLLYELGVANDQGRWYVTWIEVVPDAP